MNSLLKTAGFAAVIASSLWSFQANAAEEDNAKAIEDLKAQVEALASALEENKSPEKNVQIGGYGEHHLNNLSGDDKDMVDAHRFVLFFGHQYSDTLKFFSEFELEHSLAGEGEPGEVELEQAFIEKTLENGNRLTMGLFLIPVGLLNETHEPNTFYGVERNPVEGNVIPSTWWETGAMYSGDTEFFSYDLAVHSALKALDLDDTGTVVELSSLRSARQKSAEADGNEAAVTARIKGSPVDGVELGATYQFQSDISGALGLNVDASLLAVNAVWQKDKFTSKLVYAMWDIDDKVDTLISGYSEQEGLTAEVGYKVRDDLGVFTRYSEWDNAAADSAESGFDQVNVGVNYWLDERVAVKADYQMQTSQATDDELNGVNLGLGWSF